MDFVQALTLMNRIAIIGPSGAGKSTLARELGRRTGLPVWHLDKLWWRPGWVETDEETFDQDLRDVVAGEKWIIDGNYSRTFDIRLPRADLILYLDFPRRIYFRRVLWRIAKGYGRTRPDLAEECPEQFDPEFLRFVWNIPKKSRPRTLAALQQFQQGSLLLTLRSPKDVRKLLERLERGEGYVIDSSSQNVA